MRSRFAILLAIAVVCVMTARAEWTSESLVTGSPGVWRTFSSHNSGHKVVYGTDGVGHLVWQGGPLTDPYPGIWYNRYNPGQPGAWTADFGVAPYSPKKKVAYTAPCVALDGDGRTFHVVWAARPTSNPFAYPDTICYRICTQDRKGNDKWGAVVHLYAAWYAGFPAVACVPNEANHVLVCWGDGATKSVIRFREYVNGAWQAVVRLDSGHGASKPAIAAAPNGEVFVAYTSGQQVFVKTRTNGAWGEPVNVAENFSGLGCGPAAIEASPITGNPHLVFGGVTEVPTGGDPDTLEAVYHTYRTGGSWLTTPEAISEPHCWPGTPVPVSRCRPTMGFGGSGAAHVAWFDTLAPTSSGAMYSSCSSEGGAWSAPEWLTSYPTIGGQFITVDEHAHALRVVWGRITPGNNDPTEIWWKSNYLGGDGGEQAQPMALSQPCIELFPNPAKAGHVTVHYALPHAGPMTVTLVDVSGRAVRTQEFAASDRGSATIDVKGLNAGVYVARLVARDVSVSKSLVVGR